MKPIVPPDLHFLMAALGWLELGNPAEAMAELERLSLKTRQHPDVLEVRWAIHAKQANWTEALKAAQSLLKTAPERSSGWLHRAYSLRRVSDGGIQEAFDALRPAFEKFPNEPTIPYNLACYVCQMERLPEARTWLKQALEIGKAELIKEMALADEDLKPLWAEIREY